MVSGMEAEAAESTAAAEAAARVWAEGTLRLDRLVQARVRPPRAPAAAAAARALVELEAAK